MSTYSSDPSLDGVTDDDGHELDAGDTQSALLVAGLPGSTVVTVTDGALSATLAVDVVPSGVATITITPGAVETQPTA